MGGCFEVPSRMFELIQDTQYNQVAPSATPHAQPSIAKNQQATTSATRHRPQSAIAKNQQATTSATRHRPQSAIALADSQLKQQVAALRSELFECQQSILDSPTKTTQPGDNVRCRELEHEMSKLDAMRQTVAAARCVHMTDLRYSVFPCAVPARVIRRLSAAFLKRTKLLDSGGNTFGDHFEQEYEGHRNYFYHINRGQTLPETKVGRIEFCVGAGSEIVADIFAELDHYTRTVISLHHPGEEVALDRAFGAFYEDGHKREGFFRGVSEHCDGGASLVSTVVHATVGNGAGFRQGGQLVITEAEDMNGRWCNQEEVSHNDASIGSIVYVGPGVYHHANPIGAQGKRMVFCLFYATTSGQAINRTQMLIADHEDYQR